MPLFCCLCKSRMMCCVCSLVLMLIGTIFVAVNLEKIKDVQDAISDLFSWDD
jgi:hypothetical protein